MERYIIREPRMSEFPPNIQNTNQMIAIAVGNESDDEGMFLERPLRPIQNNYPLYVQYTPANNKQVFNNMQMNSSGYMVNCVSPAQRPVMSGIDPRYLAAYADPNANYIATGRQMQKERDGLSANTGLGGDYQNRSAQERSRALTFMPTERQQEQTMIMEPPKAFQTDSQTNWKPVKTKSSQETMILETPKPRQKVLQNNWQPVNNTPTKKIETSDVNKPEIQNQIMSRADKLKALHRSGARVFSGPVEMILKWHKALQDIGVYVIYEIVAKCVSIRPGENCAKNLVVRDDSGPAMQIVYYEVDFLLPQLKPPCTVRIIGRMMSGTSRFQAFNVRSATGDDVATLPRRAAVAAHHVAKLCKEFAV